MVIFEIQNKKEDYAICYSIMQFIAEPSNSFRYNNSIIVKLAETEIPDDGSETKKILSEAYNKRGESPARSIFSSAEMHNFINRHPKATYSTYCFFVYDNADSDESDVVNYHYFELIRQFNPNKSRCVLGIIPGNLGTKSEKECLFRISAFFHAESNSDIDGFNARLIFESNPFRISNFVKTNKASKRFFPLLPTNSETYRVLAQSVHELFSKGDNQSELFNDKLRDDLVGSSKTSTNRYEVYAHSVKQYVAKLYDELTIKLQKKLIKENLQIDFPRERMVSLSVLAAAYFLTFIHSIILPDGCERTSVKKLREIPIEEYCSKFEEMINDAEDFAEGTLQLIENAKKHAGSKGFLCFRVFSELQARRYFKKNLPYSVGGQYLNMLISDFNNEFDVPKKFLGNLPAYGTDADLAAEFGSIGLKLRDFFEPSDEARICWNEYFKHTKNVALHYGLSVFDRVVSYAGGSFQVASTPNTYLYADDVYQTDSFFTKADGYPYIPGTQYNIMLPLTAKSDSKPTGLNIAFDYSKHNAEHTKFITVLAEEAILELAHADIAYKYESDNKERRILKLTEFLINKVNGASSQLLIYTERITDPLSCEIFSKAIVCCLGEKIAERIAIANASTLLRAALIRIIGTLYYKRINSGIVRDVEIYICGTFGRPEIEFVGNSISTSIAATETLAKGRAEYTRDITLLNNIMQKSDDIGLDAETELFPFDMVVFRQLVLDDLNRDIQKYPFGCKLSDIHMRVGSKIHLTDCFYEATLLFGIENYVSRFASILAQKIRDKITDDMTTKKIVLVGYETYSELLILETKEALGKPPKGVTALDCEYIIYDDSAEEKFRDYERLPDLDMDNTTLIIIVPIGSTLTTHDKIAADLERYEKFNKINKFSAEKNILINLCVVLVRDDDAIQERGCTVCEKMFWTSADAESIELGEEYTIGSDNKVDYIISVAGKWEIPNECHKCFHSIPGEKPILKIDKTSVVPMVQFGLTETKPAELMSDDNNVWLDSNIELLRDAVNYGHFKRGGNHFEYFPDTGKLITIIFKENLTLFEEWLKKTGDCISKSSKNNISKYDFIVAPQHHTNAGFVMKVCEKAFDNSAAIVWLDVKSEFRDNFKAKYSYLSQVFMNLTDYGIETEIHFHYVDDTITTGATYERAKDLLRSMFNFEAFSEKGYKGVKVVLFSSVTVLVNRHSYDSIRKYAPLGRYFSFINLHISSLRNHEDACVLCKKQKDYTNMRRLSASNDLAKEFQDRVNTYEVVDYKDTKNRFDGDKEQQCKKDSKGCCRMRFTHEINTALGDLTHEAINETKVSGILWKVLNNIFICDLREWEELFPGSPCALTEAICSFLHVISSPFFSFGKSNLEAALQLLLDMADWIIFKDRRDKYPSLLNNANFKRYFKALEMDKDKRKLTQLLKCVFYRLSHLGANYIVKEDVINAFFEYTNCLFVKGKIPGEDIKEQTNWNLFYTKALKQVLVFHPFDNRSLQVENVLERLRKSTEHKEFADFALLENNILIDDALREVTRALKREYSIYERTTVDKTISVLFSGPESEKNRLGTVVKTLNYYFCETYRLFETGTKDRIRQDRNETINDTNKTDETDKAEESVGIMMFHMSTLALLLIPNINLTGDSQQRHYYQHLLGCIAKIIGAQKVQMFLEKTDKSHFVQSSNEDEYKEEPGWNGCWKECREPIGDTCFYKITGNRRLAAIKVGNNLYDEDVASKAAWYFVFEADGNDDEFPALTNARNLLVMREELLMRLNKDFNHNLVEEFLDLNKKVIKLLPNDKIGGHTPFEELSVDFERLRQMSSTDNTTEQQLIATQLKFISDELISKLYVCHINDDKYPKQIVERKDDVFPKKLRNYKNIMLMANKLSLKTEDSTEVEPRISFDVDWELTFDFLDKAEFVWIVIYYTLILNALRHGFSNIIDGDEFKRYVDLSVKTDNGKLTITNEYLPYKNGNENSITQETIKAFLDKFGFEVVFPEKPEKHEKKERKQYSVSISLKKWSVKNECKENTSN